MGEVIEGAMQQAPQPARHSIALISVATRRGRLDSKLATARPIAPQPAVSALAS
jgi:hypothetical protein